MKIIFAGTPEFAVPSLKACIESGYQVCAVYTQPDRPSGRGRKIVASPIKELATTCGLPVCQPESLRSPAEIEALHRWNADLMVVAAYGLIMPAQVLAAPRLGCINVHASLLPRWRGAAPIQRAILAGDRMTGVTIMRIEPQLDAGPIILSRTCEITATDTSAVLYARLATIGAEALAEALAQFASGPVLAHEQDPSLVTYADKLSKAEAVLDWTQPAQQIERMIRAFNPWPVAETHIGQQVLRVWQAETLDELTHEPPGTTLEDRKTWDVATGHGVLRLLEVQLAGRRRMPGSDCLRAFSLPLRLGDLIS